MRTRISISALAALAALFGSAHPAQANGAFPLANQLLAHPTDPTHLLMRGNFGLVVSRDSGGSWDWLCETGMGYENIEPPMAVLGSGVVLLALPGGISRSDPSWCDFALASGISENVVDLSIARGTPGAAVAVSYDLAAMSSALWASSDDGASWSAVGEAFTDFQVTSVDVAASDSDRIYVSGRTLPGGPGTLLRSDDQGETFTAHEIPSVIASLPYIAAVDPEDPDTVYVRRNGLPGTLWVTRDGGESFTLALRTDFGPMKAFALSPDGETVLAGNLTEGIHRAAADSLTFERITCDGVQCLSWNDAGLFACGDLLVNGYLVAESTDEGETFDVILKRACVRGPLECDAATSTSMCVDDWAMVQKQISPLECADDPGGVPPSQACFETGGAGGAGGAGGSGTPDSAGASGAVESGAGGQSVQGEGGLPAVEEEQLKPGGGGFCALDWSGEDAWPWALLAVGAFRIRRRRRRGRDH